MTNKRYENPDTRPLPPEVYMRRRVAALVIILVVVGLVVWGLTAWARSGSGSPDGAESTAPATPTEQVTTEPTVPEPTDEATTTTTPTTAGTSPAQPTGSTEPSVNAAGKTTCELQDLSIEASTSAPSYAVGEQPVFYMKVDNPTAADCQVNLDEQQLRFEVYEMASNRRVWSDTDCYPSVVVGQETFKPNEPRTFQARWSGTGSQPGQCANREPVGPGSYYLHAVIGNDASNPVDFTLR